MERTTPLITRSFQLPQYTNRDWWIFLRTMPFIVVLIGWVLTGNLYFTNLTVFLSCSATTFAVLTALWLSITWLAVTVRNRFSRDKDLVKRLVIFIPLIVLISWLALTILFKI